MHINKSILFPGAETEDYQIQRVRLGLAFLQNGAHTCVDFGLMLAQITVLVNTIKKSKIVLPDIEISQGE
jgi:hypothetical protein